MLASMGAVVMVVARVWRRGEVMHWVFVFLAVSAKVGLSGFFWLYPFRFFGRCLFCCRLGFFDSRWGRLISSLEPHVFFPPLVLSFFPVLVQFRSSLQFLFLHLVCTFQVDVVCIMYVYKIVLFGPFVFFLCPFLLKWIFELFMVRTFGVHCSIVRSVRMVVVYSTRAGQEKEGIGQQRDDFVRPPSWCISTS